MTGAPAPVVLVIAPGRDGELVERLLGDSGIACRRMESVEAAATSLDDGTGALIVAEELLSGRSVEGLAAALAQQSPWSDLPILLVAHHRQRRARASWLPALGNVAVLTRPMAIEALASAVSTALRARQRQYQVRDLLRGEQEEARRKDEFLAMLAHELRNPLAPVRFASQVLATADLPPERIRETSALIGRQVTHMARIVDDLLEVSRVTRGLVALVRETLDLAALAREIAADRRPAAERRGVDLVVRDTGPVTIDGDGTRLKQVLDNLLDNAVKFSRPGGTVTVDVTVRDACAVLSVTDEGEGLEPDLIPWLFQPFAQADRSLDRRRGGLGLGLALVAALTRLHGGEVSARSAGPGHGSTFTVTVPCKASGSATAGASARDGRSASATRGLQVLVVEDNVDTAESLRLLLEIAGHRVMVAHTGSEALERAMASPPDVVLCDIGLPGMSGYEVARRLQAMSPRALPRLIAITGYANEDDRRRAAAAGFERHLRKPVEPEVLMAELARVPARAGSARSAAVN